MQGVQKKLVAGLLCVGLASFIVTGCRSAQQFARQPVNQQPAEQSTAQPAAGAKTAPHESGVKKGSREADAKQTAKDQQLAVEAKTAASSTAKAAQELFTGLKTEMGDDPYPSSGEIVNINYASESHIQTLPGINHELAMRIIRNRPYATPTDLISKRVLTKGEYERIKTRLTAWDNLWTSPD